MRRVEVGLDLVSDVGDDQAFELGPERRRRSAGSGRQAGRGCPSATISGGRSSPTSGRGDSRRAALRDAAPQARRARGFPAGNGRNGPAAVRGRSPAPRDGSKPDRSRWDGRRGFRFPSGRCGGEATPGCSCRRRRTPPFQNRTFPCAGTASRCSAGTRGNSGAETGRRDLRLGFSAIHVSVSHPLPHGQTDAAAIRVREASSNRPWHTSGCAARDRKACRRAAWPCGSVRQEVLVDHLPGAAAAAVAALAADEVVERGVAAVRLAQVRQVERPGDEPDPLLGAGRRAAPRPAPRSSGRQ